MRYTIRHGVERAFSERFRGNLPILLPLLVILALVAAWAWLPHGKHQKPSALGIYTIKTSDQNGSSNSNNKSNNQTKKTNPGSAGGISVNGQPASLSPIGGRGSSMTSGTSLGGASSPVSSGVAPVSGGMGGGLTGGGTSGGGGGGTPTPTSTVVCDNTGGLLPITCTACSPPLVVAVGQKVLLSNSGSCSLIN